jgi:uncharacterized pyridoxamine 5'-phosphate oxidase family protein
MAVADFKNALNDTNEIELTTTGRTSGRQSSRPLWFVTRGESLYLLPVTGSDSQWYKNVLKTPTIGLAAVPKRNEIDRKLRLSAAIKPQRVISRELQSLQAQRSL